MSKKHPRDDGWDMDSMIWNAKLLKGIVEELERHGSEVWPSDPLLFQGAELAGAIRVVVGLKFQKQ